MADAMRSLLAAYLSDAQSQAQPNTLGAFPWLASVYVVQSPELLPPDWSTELPTLLIYPQVTAANPLCLGDVADEKIYSIVLTLCCEGFGDETAGLFGAGAFPGLLTMLDAIETRYRRNTLNITQQATLARIDYTLRRIPPFLHRGINQGHLTIQHMYVDMRP